MNWQEVLPEVYLYRDSCNVYAVRGPDGMLIVDAGTGRWLQHLDELPARPAALALTHFFRDHAAGAAAAAHAGIPVHVGACEEEIIADPQQHFRQRETYIIYDNQWDLFAPIEPTPIAGVLHDFDAVSLAGMEVQILPLSGVTTTQIGLCVERGQRGRVVFCGEAIHSPGRLARVAPLQYNYNDLPGAIHAYDSARRLRQSDIHALLPSLGNPIVDAVDPALEQLQESLRYLVEDRPGMTELLDQTESDDLVKVTDHVYMATRSGSSNWFLVSETRKALAIDFGYRQPSLSANYPKRHSRRADLHSIEALKSRFGIDGIDVALISHFHDDHVCGVPLLQRLFDTQCWAAANFADLLADPSAHCFPCTWPEPLRVHRRIGLDEVVDWEGFRFHFAPMSGHTRFAALIGFEADGKRYAHTGDQYFFQKGVDGWSDNVVMQNHVYRNGALLDGYDQSGQWLLDWRPDVIISGHQPPMHTDDDFFHLIEAYTEQYRGMHRRAMVLEEEETHFDLDSWGGWIWPYRTVKPGPEPVNLTVTVRNPYPRGATLEVKLEGPEGWSGTGATLSAGPREEVSCQLQITPAGACRRQPVAVDLVADGRPFGQVAEALVTVGGDRF